VLRSVRSATARKLDLETDASLLHLSSVKVNIVHPAKALLAVCFLLVTLNTEAVCASELLQDCREFHSRRQYSS
jgi:hypothetical protein